MLPLDVPVFDRPDDVTLVRLAEVQFDLEPTVGVAVLKAWRVQRRGPGAVGLNKPGDCNPPAWSDGEGIFEDVSGREWVVMDWGCVGSWSGMAR